MYTPQLRDVQRARQNIAPLVIHTPLMQNSAFSDLVGANILLKREDLQVVRSYKLRGAYNKILSLSAQQRTKGIVCASAGNHAQGVAYSCSSLQINGAIFMPVTTPMQKKRQVQKFGGNNVTIISVGDTFDDAFGEAQKYCKEHDSNFIHPFDDEKIIEGQATVGFDILDDANVPIDYLFVPIGGGGLAAGIGSVFKSMSPDTKIIGVEPAGAASMKASIDAGEVVTLDTINTFADGVAVRRAGNLTYNICKNVLHDIVVVPEGKICTTILQLYNDSAIVVEPAGAISIAALDFYKDKIKGKNVVCIVSGSNNDITRMEEIKERSQLYEGLKHYFIIRFAQRAGALREFLNNVLGDTADITHFEYKRKNFMEKGSAIIGIEIKHTDDIKPLLARMDDCGIAYDYLNEQEDLFHFLI
jgi:threonine dehydratase